jgi:hypothetical protein
MVTLALLLASLHRTPRPRVAQCQALTKTAHPPITVRGRLYAANGGGSGFRIWIVGTTRIVWLTAKIDPALPIEITRRFTPFDEVLYGNFTVVPLRQDRPGVMREVCFVSGDRLTVRAADPERRLGRSVTPGDDVAAVALGQRAPGDPANLRSRTCRAIAPESTAHRSRRCATPR